MKDYTVYYVIIWLIVWPTLLRKLKSILNSLCVLHHQIVHAYIISTPPC